MKIEYYYILEEDYKANNLNVNVNNFLKNVRIFNKLLFIFHFKTNIEYNIIR